MNEEPGSASVPTAPPAVDRWGRARRLLSDRRWLALGLALLITVAILLLHEQLHSLGNYGYPGLFLISLAGNATVVLPAPSLAVAFAAGSSFNPWLVGLSAGTGAALGELTGYLAGVGGQVIVEQQPGYARVRGWMNRYGLWVVFVLSVIPSPVLDIAGMVSGVMRIPAWRFFAACWPGKFIKFAAAAYLGAQTATLLDLLGRLLSR
jgi:membrane protein YqaA with SNARE-associated domain